MSLLQQIQESVVSEKSDLSLILLKLRLLADRLGSDILEDWVKFEAEGYPKDVTVPKYRVVDVSFRGSFYGAFGAGITNAQIPPVLIEKFAGKNWTTYKVRESIAVIEQMIKKSNDGGSFGIDASNLILLLQGKIYEGYSCNDVSATINQNAFYEIQQSVRSKILELTIELEKNIPGSIHIAFGTSGKIKAEPEQVQQISQQISQQIIYGNVNTALTGGSNLNIISTVNENDLESLRKFLVDSGITNEDAIEISSIMESEKPESSIEPFGKKSKKWIAENLKKAASGTWKVGISVATELFTEAALKFYGLK